MNDVSKVRSMKYLKADPRLFP